MFFAFIGVALLTVAIEWLVIFISTKTKLIDKFLPKQDAKNSYIQFKAGGIDAHFEGNIIDATKGLLNFFFPAETAEEKIDNRINAAIGKNTEKVIDAILSNKNVQKQMQEQIFGIVKEKLDLHTEKGKKK